MDISGFPYSLRVDIPKAEEEQITLDQRTVFHELFQVFEDWTDIEVTDYIIGFEISSNSKPHLQSIIWFAEEL